MSDGVHFVQIDTVKVYIHGGPKELNVAVHILPKEISMSVEQFVAINMSYFVYKKNGRCHIACGVYAEGHWTGHLREPKSLDDKFGFELTTRVTKKRDEKLRKIIVNKLEPKYTTEELSALQFIGYLNCHDVMVHICCSPPPNRNLAPHVPHWHEKQENILLVYLVTIKGALMDVAQLFCDAHKDFSWDTIFDSFDNFDKSLDLSNAEKLDEEVVRKKVHATFAALDSERKAKAADYELQTDDCRYSDDSHFFSASSVKPVAPMLEISDQDPKTFMTMAKNKLQKARDDFEERVRNEQSAIDEHYGRLKDCDDKKRKRDADVIAIQGELVSAKKRADEVATITLQRDEDIGGIRPEYKNTDIFEIISGIYKRYAEKKISELTSAFPHVRETASIDADLFQMRKEQIEYPKPFDFSKLDSLSAN